MKGKFLEVILAIGILALLISTFAQTWTQTGAPTNASWYGIASSADGKIICAVNSDSVAELLLSTNSGVTWTNDSFQTSQLGGYGYVASSADGTILIAPLYVNGLGNYFFVSTNSGNTWVQTSVSGSYAVASSSDGAKLAAASIASGFIYTSTNFGSTWQLSGAPSNYWSALASSADGTKLVAAASSEIIISTNSGVTWTANTSLFFGSGPSSASSADGGILAVAGGNVYVSTNSGGSWISTPVTGHSVASSADGKRLAVAGSQIWTSTNSGLTWTTGNAPFSGACVASSADGCKLIVGTYRTGIWIGQITPSPQLNIKPANGKLALSWIVPSTNFVLQQNSNLSAANWATLSNSPTLNLANLQDEIILSPSNSSGFFRLIAQ
jgi:hypothetical protein